MNSIKLLFFLFLCVHGVAKAQMRLSGKVSDTKGAPVENVIVKLVNGARTYCYAFTNKNGEYAMEVSDSVRTDEIRVVFSHIGYDTQEQVLKGDGRNKRADAVLTPNTQLLPEVRIKSSPLLHQGDTLRCSLASFLGKGDVTLEDGIKRLPGIEVSKSGAISYMGRGISHFYIEGLDMLGGRYNLATRNIPAEYTSSVEILRNHKDKKIDHDEESDAVALNVRLKNKAKFRPFGQSQVGVGWQEDDALYAVGLTGMMFMNDFQTICSGKYSNSGNFASYDMTDHFGNTGIGSCVMSLLGGFGGGRPPKGEYLYQTNGMASLNAIRRVDSLLTVKTNVNYAYEDSHYAYSTASTYFAGGENLTLNESMSPGSRLHRPSVEMNFRKDERSKFINNTLRFRAQIEQNESPVTRMTNGQDEIIGQNRRASGFEVTNTLYTRMLVGKNKLGLNSYVRFVRTPKLNMDFSFSGAEAGSPDSRIVQSGQETSFQTKESSSFTLNLSDKIRIHLPVSIDASYNFIETVRMPNIAMNRLGGWRVSPSVSPSFEWKFFDKRLWTQLSSCMRWLSMSYKPTTGFKRVNLHDVYFEPSVRMKYSFSGTSELSLSSAVNNSTGDILDLITEDVQTDYKSTHAASGVIARTNTWSTTLSYKYEKPFWFFTLNTSASWMQGKRNVLTSQFVDNEGINNSSIFGDSHYRNAGFFLKLSKNIIELHAKLNLEGSYKWNSNEMMEQGRRVTAFGHGYNVHASASVAPLKWMELNYDIDFARSFTRFVGQRNRNESLSHIGGISVFPIEHLEVKASYDNVRQQIADGHFKNFTLFDATAQLKMKRSILKMSLQNILNTKHYSWTVFDGVNTFSYNYKLCGRTLMMTLIYTR